PPSFAFSSFHIHSLLRLLPYESLGFIKCRFLFSFVYQYSIANSKRLFILFWKCIQKTAAVQITFHGVGRLSIWLYGGACTPYGPQSICHFFKNSVGVIAGTEESAKSLR